MSKTKKYKRKPNNQTIKVKVRESRERFSWRNTWKWVLIILLCLTLLIGVGSCSNRKESKTIKVSEAGQILNMDELSFFEKMWARLLDGKRTYLFEKPSWFPTWFQLPFNLTGSKDNITVVKGNVFDELIGDKDKLLCDIHEDLDGDGICDNCKEPMDIPSEEKPSPDSPPGDTPPTDEPTECEHRDADDNGKCDYCGGEFVDGDEQPEAPGDNPPTDKPPTDAPGDNEEIETYKITFNPNGGELSSDSVIFETDKNGKLSYFPVCQREGYTFLYWTLNVDGGEALTIETVFTTDVTLYAQYEAEEVEEPECVHVDTDLDNRCDKCGQAVVENEGGNPGMGEGTVNPDKPQEPDEPQEPEEPECEHVDKDDNGKCDKCAETFEDGKEPEPCDHRDADDDGKCDNCAETFEDGKEPEPCDHRDADDNGKCDKCGETFEDGKEPEPCDHRDADDNGKCDKCGEPFTDGKEPEPEEPECVHRDADDDGKCDKCGKKFEDGNEPGSGSDNEPGSGSDNDGGEIDLLYDDDTGCEYYIGHEGTYVYSTGDGFIPREIQGQPVVGISDYFYVHCMEKGIYLLEDVNYVIPDTVLYIGDYAFAGAAFSSVEAGQIELLTVVYEGPGMEYVGTCAFAGNAYLTYVDIPCSDTCIFGEEIFANCVSLSKDNVNLGLYEAIELG